MVALVALLALGLVNAGCARMLPSDPFSPAYVVNRGGHYFAGSRCGTILEAGVFPDLPFTGKRDATAFDAAFWHATVEPAAGFEWELFASSQPGVVVLSDDGRRPNSSLILVLMRDTWDNWVSVALTLEKIGDGMVTSAAGLMSWDDFMKMSNWNFGC